MNTKSFELRKNDRGFKSQDFLRLREYIPEGGYTGRVIYARVDYILEGFAGLEAGYCIMQITVVTRREAEEPSDNFKLAALEPK